MFSTLKRLTNKTSDKDTTITTTTHPKVLSQDLQRSFSKGIQYNLKLVIKGDRNVGKTCLWSRLQGKPFIANYEETNEIQVAHIQWNYKNTEDVVKVEVWDVVDKGKRQPLSSSKSCDVLKTEHNKVKLSPIPLEDTPVLDAELVDVYRYTNGVLLVLDITKRWTLDYVYKELPKIPDNIPILILGNHCDMNHHRSVNGDEVIYYLKTLGRCAPIRYAEVSMSNGFGLRLIYKWIGISFLQLQRENIMNHLETNGRETKIMTMELDVYQKSDEANYDIFLSRLSKQRRVDAENKSATPTLPLPLLNKPSPNAKELKLTVESQNQKSIDSKTQDIAQKMFPTNKSYIVQNESNKEVETFKEEPVTKLSSIGNINHLDDFVPDDVLDNSFLEDAGHGDIIVRSSKETEMDSDESDNDCGNPMVAGYQADVDPDDFTPLPANLKIVKNNMESTDHDNWSSIHNTTRPRPEGEEGEESKSHVDGLSSTGSKKAAIWHCLNHYAYSDAIFLAERLCAEFDSDESIYLLATCYYRSGKPSQAYSILNGKKIVSEKCKFLLARCCVDLHKLSEAETVLTGNVGDLISTSTCMSFIESIISDYGDSAPFALQLISHIWWRSERSHLAAEACRKALYLNPFLWKSFQDLCDRGVKPDPEPTKIFKVDNLDNFNKCLGSNSNVNSTPLSTYNLSYESINTFNSSTPAQKMVNMSVPSSNSSISSGIQPFTPDMNNAKTIFVRPIGRKVKVINENAYSPLTPSFGVFPLENSDNLSICSSQAMVLVPSTALNETNDQKFISKRSSKPVFSQSGNTSNINNLGTQQITMPSSPMSHVVRRSSRIITNNCSVKENTKSPSKKFVSPKSATRKIKSGLIPKKSVFADITERNPKERGVMEVETMTLAQQALNLQKKTTEGLLSLLRDIGIAYLQLSKFNCRKSIQLFQSLPPRQYKTGFILSMIGKAYCEQSDYQQSIKYFSEVRELEPYRDTLMELYSTSLWHQQKEIALSALAQDMTALDRNSSSTWCVVGNCFSLQKEHQTAIKYFQRAIQVNPDFPYAYALLGNEYLVTEELEKAITCFQKAVKLDPRHYKSWYGIGAIYQKQERYELAEMHYKRALRINHSSALIMCHIAVVQNSMDKPDQALHTLHIALTLEPKHPMCKYQRAQIYSKLGKLPEALYELEELKEIVPKESLVYFLTGKVHKKLGNIHLALMNFNRATDLDPKGASNQIKEAIDPTNNQSPLDDSDDP